MCGHWLGHQTLHTKSRLLPSQQKQQHKESNDIVSPALKGKYCAQTVLGPLVRQWSKPKLATPHFLPEYRKIKTTERFWKITRTKDTPRDWAIERHGTSTKNNGTATWWPEEKSNTFNDKLGIPRKIWTIALWVGPLINELIHALNYLMDAIN